jgi:hypothetical protein
LGHFLVVVVIRFALDSAVDLSTESTRISQTRCGMKVFWVPTAILRGDSWLLSSPSTATSPLRLESVPGEVSQLSEGDTSMPLGPRLKLYSVDTASPPMASFDELQKRRGAFVLNRR